MLERWLCVHIKILRHGKRGVGICAGEYELAFLRDGKLWLEDPTGRVAKAVLWVARTSRLMLLGCRYGGEGIQDSMQVQ